MSFLLVFFLYWGSKHFVHWTSKSIHIFCVIFLLSFLPVGTSANPPPHALPSRLPSPELAVVSGESALGQRKGGVEDAPALILSDDFMSILKDLGWKATITKVDGKEISDAIPDGKKRKERVFFFLWDWTLKVLLLIMWIMVLNQNLPLSRRCLIPQPMVALFSQVPFKKILLGHCCALYCIFIIKLEKKIIM